MRADSAEVIKMQSKEWLLNALLHLMQTKQYNDIAIVDICDEAGLSRQTFYRHYKDKESLIMSYFNRIFTDLYDQIDNLKDKNIGNICTLYLQFWQKYKAFTYLLNVSGCEGNSLLCNQIFFRKALKYVTITENVDQQVIVDFLAGAMYSILEAWIRDDYKTDAMDLSKQIEIIISSLNQ